MSAKYVVETRIQKFNLLKEAIESEGYEVITSEKDIVYYKIPIVLKEV